MTVHTQQLPRFNPALQRVRALDWVRGTVQAFRMIRSRTIDWWLNISTPYPNPKRFSLETRFADAVPNEPVDYVLMRRFIKAIQLRPNDVVYDVGCGMGRALCTFARRPVAKCVGIEFDPELAAIAEMNAKQLRGRKAAVEVRVGDAAEADYAGANVIWMFNPFGTQTLRAVLTRIHQSLIDSPRYLQIVYVNPVFEREMAACPWLERTHYEYSPFFPTYGASYWHVRVDVVLEEKAGRLHGKPVTSPVSI